MAKRKTQAIIPPFTRRNTRSKTIKKVEDHSNNEGLSDAEDFECYICMETKPIDHILNPTACSDVFCIDCIICHVDSKAGYNVSKIKCPEPKCKELIPFEGCLGLVPKPVLIRWEEVISKSTISSIVTMYCPYKDCSAGLLDAQGATCEVAEPSNKVECPHCKRSFCVECKSVAWETHHGLTCEEFKKLGDDERQKEDIELRKLAQDQRWGRCPKCLFYVERTSGCNHIYCRCKCEFCYTCGGLYSQCGGTSSCRRL